MPEEQVLEHCKTIDALSLKIEALVAERDTAMKARDTAMKERDTAIKERTVLEENTDTLRALVVEYMGGPAPAVRQRSDRERRFWDELATPGLLAASQPPEDYMADAENGLIATADPVRAVQPVRQCIC